MFTDVARIVLAERDRAIAHPHGVEVHERQMSPRNFDSVQRRNDDVATGDVRGLGVADVGAGERQRSGVAIGERSDERRA